MNNDKSKLDLLIQRLAQRLGISRQEVIERFPFFRDFDVAEFDSLDLEEFVLEIEAEFGEGPIKLSGKAVDLSEETIVTPVWWIALWSCWGTVTGAIVLWLDRNPLSAVMWTAIGIAIGTFAVRLVRPMLEPAWDWYEQLGNDPQRAAHIDELLREQQWSSPEFEQLCHDDRFGAMTAVAPMFGLFQGVLVGGLAGALLRFGAMTASHGALIGAVCCGLFASTIMAVLLAIMIPVDKAKPLQVRMSQRATMLASPMFVLPVIWHCLKWLHQRPQSSPD